MISGHLYILLGAMSLAFFITFLTTPPVIAFLRKAKLGQAIREEGPNSHQKKAGTPTMGGVTILLGLICGSLLSVAIFWTLSTGNKIAEVKHALLLLALTVGVATIGAIDDWEKIRHGRSLGLKAREKLGLQMLMGGLFAWGLYATGNGASVGIPYVGTIQMSWWWYIPLAMCFVAGMSNAVNLTDGLDGLAAGTTTASAFALAGIAWYSAHGAAGKEHAVATVLACLASACLAFLWYNQHPARVFMGDTGSLAIGAALAGAALIVKQEVLLFGIGLIFIIETATVILQVAYFQITKRLYGEGRRIFRMTPFHHHLELSGWSEPQIVTRAWLLATLLGAGAFFWFKFLASKF